MTNQTTSPLPPARNPGALMRAARRLLSWVVGVLLIPAVILVGLEGTLRAVGYGMDVAPFIKKTIDGQVVYFRNRAFMEQFYGLPIPPDLWEPAAWAITAEKPENTYRIFVFGESAAMGWPSYEYSFSRILEIMLQNKYPGARFEVYNAAYVALNSHALRRVATACAAFDPDLYILYVGNNEFGGPFSANAIAANGDVPDADLVQLFFAMTEFRVFQLLRTLHEQVFGAQPADTFVISGEAIANLRITQPGVEKIYGNFAANLEAMCRTAHRAGGRTLLATVGANLRHWSPKDSAHYRELSPEQLAQWDQAFADGRNLQEQGKFREALAAHQIAFELDDTYAELRFRVAQCYWELGEYDQAREHFTAALDWDGFFWARSKTRHGQIIRETAARFASEDVTLVDVAGALAAVSPHGVVGGEFYPDSCHSNFEGSYFIAKALFDDLRPVLPEWIVAHENTAADELSAARCAELLGYFSRIRDLQTVLEGNEAAGVGSLPYLEEQIAALHDELTPPSLEEQSETLRHSLEEFGEDYFLRARYVNALLQIGKVQEAKEQARLVAEHHPYRPRGYRLLGECLAGEGDYRGAIAYCEQALALCPEDPDTLTLYSHCLHTDGQDARALAVLRDAIAKFPTFGPLRGAEGDLLLAMNQQGEAMQAYRAAIEAQPENPFYCEKLASIYLKRGDCAGLIEEWRRATAEHPESALAWMFLGRAHVAAGDPEAAFQAYIQAAALGPSDIGLNASMAAEFLALGRAFLDREAPQRALETVREARALRPDPVALAVLEADAWIQAGEPERAEAVYLETAREHPWEYDLLDRLVAFYRQRDALRDCARMLESLARERPDEPMPRLFLGLVLGQTGDEIGAEQALRNACALAPKDARCTTALTTLLARRVQARAARGNPQEAASLCLDALGEFPESDLLCAVLYRLFPAGQGDEARIAAFEEAAARYPDSQTVRRYLGAAQRKDTTGPPPPPPLLAGGGTGGKMIARAKEASRAGRLEEALELFEQVRQASPGNPEAVLYMVDVLVALGRTSEAVNRCLAALRESPVGEMTFPVKTRLGSLYLETGRLEEALMTLSEVADAYPHRVLPFLNLGRAYADAQRGEEGIARFEALIAQQPDQPGGYMGLAGAYERVGRQEEALRYFQDAAARASQDKVTALVALGKAFERVGRLNDACQAYRDALLVDPANEPVADMLRDATARATTGPEASEAPKP